jgi:GntP family gluconate:H+ symporter
MSYMPIIVPIVLIVIRSFVTQYARNSTEIWWYSMVNFIGTPYIALLIGALASFLLPSKLTGEVTDTWISRAIGKAAEIVLITGIAGSFGRILQAIGVGDVLAGFISSLHLPSIVLPYVLSTIILIAQG